MMELKPFQETTLSAALGQRAFLNLDEQGTGKTVTQSRELAKVGAKRNLIACPVVAMGVWEYHLNLIFPELEVLRWPDVGSDCTTLITLDSLYERGSKIVRPHSYLESNEWEFFIIDECSGIKNRNAKRTKAARRIKHVEYRRGLSGTLMDNRPDELWAPLNWGWPKDFGSYWRFFGDFCDYDEPYFKATGYYRLTGPKNVAQLRQLLYDEGRAVRHLKKDVMPELPDKATTIIKLDMHGKQLRAYNEMRKEALTWIGEQEDEALPAPMVIAKLTRLGLFADGYAEYDGDRVRMSEPSNKLDALCELLENSNLPVVVFSVSTQLLHLAAARLTKLGFSHRAIEGSVSANKRTQYVDEFQRNLIDVMLCQIRSGGVAITLTAATTCIFLDRDWAPGANAQAEDRLHRLGQENAVNVIVLQSKNTIDQYRERKLNMKRSWIQEILN